MRDVYCDRQGGIMSDKTCFVITIRKIDNGFIASIENKYEIIVEEKFCKNYEAILRQLTTWFTTSLDKLKKSDK